MNVLQPDEAQEIRTAYARFAACARIMQNELEARGLAAEERAAVLGALTSLYFRPPAAPIAPEHAKLLAEQNTLLRRMISDEDVDE